MYRSQFSRSFGSRDVLAEFDCLQKQLQQQLQQTFDASPGLSASIRGWTRGSFPAMNVGTTAEAVEVYCFVPGVDPASIEVQLEKGVLSIAGERKPEVSDATSAETQRTSHINWHIDERFAGKFRRVVTLPDDADVDAVTAQYRDGVLHVRVQRRKAAEPRRITVQ